VMLSPGLGILISTIMIGYDLALVFKD